MYEFHNMVYPLYKSYILNNKLYIYFKEINKFSMSEECC